MALGAIFWGWTKNWPDLCESEVRDEEKWNLHIMQILMVRRESKKTDACDRVMMIMYEKLSAECKCH